MSPDLTFTVSDEAGNADSTVVNVSVAQQGLQIAPPVGPFEEIDGGGGSAGGRGPYLGGFELDQGQREVKKVHAFNHEFVNAGAMNWRSSGAGAFEVEPPVIFEDLVLEDAAADPVGKYDGGAEANLWAGATGRYRRFICRRGGEMCLWTGGASFVDEGGCYGSIFEDFEVEQGVVVPAPPGNAYAIGVYCEHSTRFSAFRRFRVTAARCINVEWWYGTGESHGYASHDLIFEDFELTNTFEQNDKTIFVDAGNFGITFRNGVVNGGKIYLPNNRVVDRPNVVENVVDENGNPVEVVFHNNAHDYTGPPPPNNPPSWWSP